TLGCGRAKPARYEASTGGRIVRTAREPVGGTTTAGGDARLRPGRYRIGFRETTDILTRYEICATTLVSVEPPGGPRSDGVCGYSRRHGRFGKEVNPHTPSKSRSHRYLTCQLQPRRRRLALARR